MALFTSQTNPSRHRVPVTVPQPQIRRARQPLALPESRAQKKVPISNSNTNTNTNNTMTTVNSESSFEEAILGFDSPSIVVDVSHKERRNSTRMRKDSICSESSGYSGFDISSRDSPSSSIVDIERSDSDSSLERSISNDSFQTNDSRITVRSIPVANFAAEPPIVDSSECYICYNDVEDSEKHCLNVALNKSCACRYPIHADCLNTWLADNRKCIICRAPMSISTRKMKFESPTPGSDRRLPRLKRRYQSKRERNRSTVINSNAGCVIA